MEDQPKADRRVDDIRHDYASLSARRPVRSGMIHDSRKPQEAKSEARSGRSGRQGVAEQRAEGDGVTRPRPCGCAVASPSPSVPR